MLSIFGWGAYIKTYEWAYIKSYEWAYIKFYG